MHSRRYASLLVETSWRGNLWMIVALTMCAGNLAFILHLREVHYTPRTLVLPPRVEKPFWIGGRKLDAELLRQWGLYIGDLALNFSPSNAEKRRLRLLQHAAPEAHGTLARQFAEEAERIARSRVSSSFHPNKVLASPDTLQAAVFGSRTLFSGSKVTQAESIVFILDFVQGDSGEVYLVRSRLGDVHAGNPFAPARRAAE